MKTLTYTGERGPTITLGPWTFEAGKPLPVDDDVQADQMLAKGCFGESPALTFPDEEQAASAEKPAELSPAKTTRTRASAADPGSTEEV